MATDLRRPQGDLHRRLQASRRYWETDGTDGAPLVMPGADLTRLDLREQILVGAQLQGVDLRGSFLDSALLIRAALDGARMTGTSLFAVDASKATLSEAQLTGAQAMRSIWRRAALVRADLTAARLDDADLSGAELVGARLDRASLVRANLAQAVLLDATFRGADITAATLDGSAADARTFLGASGEPTGEAIIGAQTTRRRRSETERQLEATVRETLRAQGVNLLWGFEPGPDLVAVLRGDWFAALEVSASADRERLARLAERADLIVVPDHLDVRAAINNTPIARLSVAERAVLGLKPSRLKPHGAAAVVMRQTARLRPYVALAERAQSDPSFLSRLSTYLEARTPSMLNAADRRLAESLPAHLDGRMAARGAEWAGEHWEELADLMSQAARVRQGAEISVERANELARRSRQLEEQLAAAVAPTD
jgi:uncharacterized protein YjbI with pentapeptide repeats